ncbi:hypothetical protein CGZ95_04865 [Enemella evansiae]|uniref:M20/M25/M40 family metallo-hydrolase n=1 Tax=Enemella evansiae TaxID=2016499 RepID=UPI000B961444|nr:M20/M25/M40 family metallo-hydrolase [Enemella evansiae]OYO03121.1 hypothetical protein CGZ95_04865 [Enemella evansiae]
MSPTETDGDTAPDVVRLCGELIRFDTTNWGGGRARGERACTEFVADTLRTAGWQPEILARPDAPERTNLLLRVAGYEPELPGVLVQGHLDVVPAEAEQWTHDPFAGEVADGYLYGRGAQDMKDACAMSLSTLLQWARDGVRPRRDVLFAFVADEEDTGAYGAEWLVDTYPDRFAGIGCTIGESGGHCEALRTATGEAVHLYPVACAERGSMHLRLTAHGASGHGSRPTGADAISRLLAAVTRLREYHWPLHLAPVVRAQLTESARALELPAEVVTDLAATDEATAEAAVRAVIAALGDDAGPLPWTIRASATLTMLDAGYKVNVIPGMATAEFDVRCPPGFVDQLDATLAELLGPRSGDALAWEHSTYQPPVAAPLDGPWLAAIRRVIGEFDPLGTVIPGCLGGGTDAKAFARIGIPGYGFTPLGPDPDGRRSEGQHGVDERVPVASLVTGQQMLRRFLETV